MSFRRAHAPTLAVVLALGLAACSPEAVAPTPTPTPTVLSEDDAYSQAEAAYRAYVQALNSIDISKPETFEPAFALTTGTLNAYDRKNYSAWHAEGWDQSGQAVVVALDRTSISDDRSSAQLAVCLDVTDVTLVDMNGESQVSPDRPDVQALYAVVERSAEGPWHVENVYGRADGTPC